MAPLDDLRMALLLFSNELAAAQVLL